MPRPAPTAALGDPDGDGLSNLQEYQRRLHPVGRLQRYLAEGVQNDFFSTRIALVNPSATVPRPMSSCGSRAHRTPPASW